MFIRNALAVTAVAALTGAAQAQLVIGLESTAEQIRVYDTALATFDDFLPTGISITSMTADDANRIIWYSTRSQLWRVSYDSPRTPVLVGTFNGAVTSIFGGLAWDSSANKLYGSTTTALYEVNTSTAATTLVRTITSADFGGLDYNTADGKLYAANDSTTATAPLVGSGIYTIDPPFATGAINRIAAYPSGETDVDGLAVGGGNVYLSRDLNNNRFWVYNIASATYTGPVLRPGGTTTSRVTCGAAWAPSLTAALPGVNLGVTITDPADCSVAVGGTANFTINVNNVGADPASNVTLTITVPADATGISSTPSGSLVGNTLTINLGSLAGSNGMTSATLSLTPNSGPSVDLAVSVASTEPDTNSGNNTANSSSTLAPVAPATAAIKGIISNYAPSATSDVPGQPGVKFSNGIIPGRPFFSPNGQNWIMAWDTDNPTTTQDQVLITSINGTRSVVVQEGVTALPTGSTPFGSFNGIYGINNAGQYAFSGLDNNTTAIDGYVIKWDGTQFVTVAQEGSPANPSTGALNWGTTRAASQIAANGTTAFLFTVTGLTTTTDTFVLKNDGNTVVQQEGVTSPGNQQGTPGTYQTFDSAGPGTGIYFSADHSSYVASGDTSAATTEDKYVVYNDNVVIQEGHIIPGSSFASNASVIGSINITPDGQDWYAYGNNADGQDWVVKTGTVVAQTDAPIFTGSTELYDDAPFSTTFFYAAGNDNGDYVVGGTTNAANDRANAVLVLNNTTVIARENDPIDLDNNGVFDDGVYLSVFVDDRIAVTNDAVFLVVRLRDSNAANCGATITDIGQALIRIPIAATPANGRCCIGARCAVVASAACTASGSAGASFTSGANDCNANGVFNAPCCFADYNKAGGVTVQDIFDFLSDWFNGNPNANVAGDGIVAPTVQDIFDFLSAWFSGC